MFLVKLFIFAAVFFPFFAGSTIYVLVNDISLYTHKSYPFFYISQDTSKGFDWIVKHTEEQAVFLAGEFTSNFIPGWTGRKVYVGHGVETINYLAKKKQAEDFFGEQKWDRKSFLHQKNIGYVFLSGFKEEKCLWPIKNESYLKLVFASGEVEIYQVIE